jgi:hypothetical protein
MAELLVVSGSSMVASTLAMPQGGDQNRLERSK